MSLKISHLTQVVSGLYECLNETLFILTADISHWALSFLWFHVVYVWVWDFS